MQEMADGDIFPIFIFRKKQVKCAVQGKLSPLAKLAGQFVVGLLVWFWVDLGFADLWPSIPAPSRTSCSSLRPDG